MGPMRPQDEARWIGLFPVMTVALAQIGHAG